MPVKYKGVISEIEAVRQRAGLFDVCHMGQIELTGSGALKAANYLLSNDVLKVAEGQCQYTFACNVSGGVLDDIVLYRFSDERVLLCVNAINTEKIYTWAVDVLDNKGFSDTVKITDLSENYAQLALQGPYAEKILEKLMPAVVKSLRYYRFTELELYGDTAIVSRTGYTGEDGFEIYLDPENAVKLWQDLMEAGEEFALEPCGLGARDTLRLEAGLPLYGFELSEELTPIEAGLKRFVSFTKGEFAGSDVLERQKEKGVEKILIAIEMKERGIPRAGYELYAGDEKAGHVTSGTFSPTLDKAIALAYVSSRHKDEKSFFIDIRGKMREAAKVVAPFYKREKNAKAAAL